MPQVASTSTCSSMANSAVSRAACLSVSRSAPVCRVSPGTVERVALTAAAAGRGGSSLLAVAEKKGTMILLALGRARWASEIWGVISLPPLWLTWDLAGRGRWLSLICALFGNSGRLILAARDRLAANLAYSPRSATLHNSSLSVIYARAWPAWTGLLQ